MMQTFDSTNGNQRHESEWRSTDFTSVEELQAWLAHEMVAERHTEPDPGDHDVYQHPGYRALACAGCGRPTIAGRNSTDQTCGRLECVAEAPETAAA